MDESDSNELIGHFMLMWHAFSGTAHGYTWQDQLASIADINTGAKIIGDYFENLKLITVTIESAHDLYDLRASCRI